MTDPSSERPRTTSGRPGPGLAEEGRAFDKCSFTEEKSRELGAIVLRLERIEVWTTHLRDRSQNADADVKLLGETLRDVQQASARLCEWARVKETLQQKEEQQQAQVRVELAARFQAIEAKLGGLLRDKERLLTWSAGAFAGYVAWRGAEAKDLLGKLLGLLR
ncbi:MAG: hypothetical protein KDG89_06985 [Geminicoccaceae bacterium]|nr:hypothetical protein [Geminicoccaceae bacterium]